MDFFPPLLAVTKIRRKKPTEKPPRERGAQGEMKREERGKPTKGTGLSEWR